MKQPFRWLFVLLLILVIVSIVNLALFFYFAASGVVTRKSIDSEINKSISRSVDDAIARLPKVSNGYTPVKGVDYFDGADGKDGTDGINGTDGKDSLSTHTETTVIKELSIPGKDGEDGSDGMTPEIRCNTDKNRWEIRYSSFESWGLLNGTAVRCTIESDM